MKNMSFLLQSYKQHIPPNIYLIEFKANKNGKSNENSQDYIELDRHTYIVLLWQKIIQLLHRTPRNYLFSQNNIAQKV